MPSLIDQCNEARVVCSPADNDSHTFKWSQEVSCQRSSTLVVGGAPTHTWSDDNSLGMPAGPGKGMLTPAHTHAYQCKWYPSCRSDCKVQPSHNVLSHRIRQSSLELQTKCQYSHLYICAEGGATQSSSVCLAVVALLAVILATSYASGEVVGALHLHSSCQDLSCMALVQGMQPT